MVHTGEGVVPHVWSTTSSGAAQSSYQQGQNQEPGKEQDIRVLAQTALLRGLLLVITYPFQPPYAPPLQPSSTVGGCWEQSLRN